MLGEGCIRSANFGIATKRPLRVGTQGAGCAIDLPPLDVPIKSGSPGSRLLDRDQG